MRLSCAFDTSVLIWSPACSLSRSTLTGPTEEEKAKQALALSTEDVKLDENRCDVLIQKMKSTKVKADEQLNMLLTLAQSLQVRAVPDRIPAAFSLRSSCSCLSCRVR